MIRLSILRHFVLQTLPLMGHDKAWVLYGHLFLVFDLLFLAVPIPLVNFALTKAEAIRKFTELFFFRPAHSLFELVLQHHLLLNGQPFSALFRH